LDHFIQGRQGRYVSALFDLFRANGSRIRVFRHIAVSVRRDADTDFLSSSASFTPTPSVIYLARRAEQIQRSSPTCNPKRFRYIFPCFLEQPAERSFLASRARLFCWIRS